MSFPQVNSTYISNNCSCWQEQWFSPECFSRSSVCLERSAQHRSCKTFPDGLRFEQFHHLPLFFAHAWSGRDCACAGWLILRWRHHDCSPKHEHVFGCVEYCGGKTSSLVHPSWSSTNIPFPFSSAPSLHTSPSPRNTEGKETNTTDVSNNTLGQKLWREQNAVQSREALWIERVCRMPQKHRRPQAANAFRAYNGGGGVKEVRLFLFLVVLGFMLFGFLRWFGFLGCSGFFTVCEVLTWCWF